MLFEKERHEILAECVWSEETARAVINDIYKRTISHFDPETFWPTDPNEDAEIDVNKTIYGGAAGVLWSLLELSGFLEEDLPLNPQALCKSIYEKYLKEPDTEAVVPSLLVGETGVLLICYKLCPSKDIEDRLYKIIEGNIENPTLEQLWGAPGTMLGASYMFEWTQAEKWADLYRKNADYLIATLKESIEKGDVIWTQDMYGKRIRYVGAGHGYYGNIFSLLKNIELLSESSRAFILGNIVETTKHLAMTQGDRVNWPNALGAGSVLIPRVQWCHGSPGIILSLRPFPQGFDPEMEAILEKAGELVWHAGPLTKGVGLCHGTDGNGYAFLQLFERTGKALWLHRAQQFAMYAIGQRNGRHTLYTGELGLAIYLMACIKKEGQFPILDYI